MPRRLPIRIHPEAIAEGKEAWEWYEERNAAAAEGFIQELDRALGRISEAPHRWPPHEHGTRSFLLRRFPFSVIYRESKGSVEIIAIAHGSRKPGYWTERI